MVGCSGGRRLPNAGALTSVPASAFRFDSNRSAGLSFEAMFPQRTFPAVIAPCLPIKAPQPPFGDIWLHESSWSASGSSHATTACGSPAIRRASLKDRRTADAAHGRAPPFGVFRIVRHFQMMQHTNSIRGGRFPRTAPCVPPRRISAASVVGECQYRSEFYNSNA
jgi:hypothetical protein